LSFYLEQNITKMNKLVLASLLGLLAFAGSGLATKPDMGTVIGIDLGTTYSW